MANTVTLLSYANTFGDWVVTTNALAQENNNMAANNYIKPTGTLYLNEPTIGLQVGNNAVIAGQLQVQGTGSSAYIQNNMRVDQQVYFTNTTLGLVNSGQANIGGPLLALGANNGLQVSNNAIVGGNVIITGNESIGGILNVTGNTTVNGTITVANNATFGNNITAVSNITAPRLVGSISVTTPTLSVLSSATVYGQLQVAGNFVLAGATVYSTNTFTLNANSNIGVISSFGVNRGASANASIRWNEPNQYWDIRDVNNPTSYSQILTANLISDSLSSQLSSPYVASQAAANTLNTSITNLSAALLANVTSLQSQITSNTTSLQSQITSNVNSINANVSALTSYANAGFLRANTFTFIGTTGTTITANNGIVNFVSNNGTIVTGSSNTLTINTPQDVRTTATPLFNSLTLSNALAIPQGGTGATSQGQALTNLLPSGTTAGYVLTTGGPGTFYWAAGGTGGGGTTPGTTIASTRLNYTANGTGLAYTTPTYIPGASQLRVYFDGVRQFPSEYTETSNTVCTFTSSPPVGTAILFEVDGYIINPYYANNIPYSVNGLIGSANTIQTAIDSLTSQIAFKSGTIFTGTVNAPTPTNATSNTQIATTAYVNNLLSSGSTYSIGITGNAGTATTASSANALNAGNNYQINSLGVGTGPTGTAGEIRATNNITAYYSDDRLKTRSGNIQNALAKVMTLNGFHYQANEIAQSLGYVAKPEIGVSAQEVQAVLPEVVVPAPIDEQYLTVHYDKLVPLLIEAIKELKAEIDTLKGSK
jgi:cytoskeletal protein CcmA (bactofilin family)